MSFVPPPKNNGESARKYAYRVLYNSIMGLELPPGSLLSDGELAVMLGVSRTPIREAMMSLAESKLVVIEPQKASYVSKIDLDAVEEGVFLRFHTERAILQEAIARATGEDLSRLKENLQQQKQALNHNDLDLYMDLDNRFHRLLYLSAGKPWTWSAVTRIVTHQDRVRRLQVRLGTELLWPAFEGHQHIYQCIMTRNQEDQDAFLYEHLTSGYRSALPELISQFPDYFAL